ncbi:MAG: metal-sulfur cluster assembly factor [Solirubrobacteraceae bacterium]
MSTAASFGSEADARRARAPAAAPAADGAGLRGRVLDALATVYDPELDEPITSLRFVTSCEMTPDGRVDVVLRLPTPQCAPNFAFLMAADARRAVRGVPGVREVTVALEDHYTGEEINAALSRGQGFTGAFPGETDDDDLESLRELFTRKALIARQARVCERMLGSGTSREEVVAATVAELPHDDPDAVRVLELRARLGFSAAPDAPAFVMPNGAAVTPDQLTRWLRAARLVRTSLEANGGICRSLLAFRHNLDPDEQEVGR